MLDKARLTGYGSQENQPFTFASRDLLRVFFGGRGRRVGGHAQVQCSLPYVSRYIYIIRLHTCESWDDSTQCLNLSLL